MDNTKSPLTPTDCISNWNVARQKEELATVLLSSTGNYFLLDTGNISSIFNTLHIYIGYNNENLELYALPSIVESGQNLTISHNRYKQYEEEKGAKNILNFLDYVNSKLLPISLLNNQDGIEKKISGTPNAAEEKLIQSINSWDDPEKKAAWISRLFKESSDSMVLAFDIDISDFKPGQIHACYFALNQDENENFTVDLVIINTETNQILNLMVDHTNYDKTSQYRDMARPVPPFGQDIYTGQNEFGILGALGIN